MNILYCGDKGIKDGLLVSILSILKHNQDELHFYLLTIDYTDKNGKKTEPFTDKSANFLDTLVKQTNKNNFFRKIDATKVFVENLPKKNMSSYFTPCSMLRLYADKIPDLPDKILYLDYDVVCRRPLNDFYATDMENYEAAGVLDIYGKFFYHYHFPKTDYMNSGVMLFNLKKCRENKTLERSASLCSDHWMMLADQAALNKTITKRKLMPRKYNEQAERPKEDTVLHHFSNNFKLFPFFHVQKVKPHETEKIHKILKITEYDDILKRYEELKNSL